MTDNHVHPKVDDFELKVVISNSDILAEIVSASVKEFMGMSRDEIKRYWTSTIRGHMSGSRTRRYSHPAEVPSAWTPASN